MRNNNFDILHLLCAILVIISHSYALVGLRESEPLLRLTGNMIASDIGLCGFFTISGYFILNSLVMSKNIFSYIGKRCLRIFPALVVCLVVVIGACSLFYTGDGSYWGQKETYSFIWRNLALFPIQWDIPGVFVNNYASTINGSLWTLAPQFTLYLLIIALFFVRKHRSVVVGLTIAALVLILTKNIVFADKLAHTEVCGMGVNSFARFAQYFVVGMLLQERRWCKTDRERWIVIGICVAAILCMYVCMYAAVGYGMHIRYIHHGRRNVLAEGERCVQACWRLVVRGVYLQFSDTADDYCKYTRCCTEDYYGVNNCNRFASGICFVANY